MDDIHAIVLIFTNLLLYENEQKKCINYDIQRSSALLSFYKKQLRH